MLETGKSIDMFDATRNNFSSRLLTAFYIYIYILYRPSSLLECAILTPSPLWSTLSLLPEVLSESSTDGKNMATDMKAGRERGGLADDDVGVNKLAHNENLQVGIKAARGT